MQAVNHQVMQLVDGGTKKWEIWTGLGLQHQAEGRLPHPAPSALDLSAACAAASRSPVKRRGMGLEEESPFGASIASRWRRC